MSLAYASGLGVPAVDLIFRLQLYPALEFTGSNTDKKRRLLTAKNTLNAQKAVGLTLCAGLPKGAQYFRYLEDALVLVERLSPLEAGETCVLLSRYRVW